MLLLCLGVMVTVFLRKEQWTHAILFLWTLEAKQILSEDRASLHKQSLPKIGNWTGIIFRTWIQASLFMEKNSFTLSPWPAIILYLKHIWSTEWEKIDNSSPLLKTTAGTNDYLKGYSLSCFGNQIIPFVFIKGLRTCQSLCCISWTKCSLESVVRISAKAEGKKTNLKINNSRSRGCAV